MQKMCECGQHWAGRCDADFPARTDPKTLRAWAEAHPETDRAQKILSRLNVTLRKNVTLSEPVVTLTQDAKCDVCGKEFEAKRATARYCSDSCRKMASRRKG